MSSPLCIRTSIALLRHGSVRSTSDAKALQQKLRSSHVRKLSVTPSRPLQQSLQKGSAAADVSSTPLIDDLWIPFEQSVDSTTTSRAVDDHSLPSPFTPPPPPRAFVENGIDQPDHSKQAAFDQTYDEEPAISLQSSVAPDSSFPPKIDKGMSGIENTVSRTPMSQTRNASRGSRVDATVGHASTQKDTIARGALYRRAPIKGNMFADPSGKAQTETRGSVREKQEKVAYPKRDDWRIQKQALQEKFDDGCWNPRKRLSPDALEGIRAMNAQYPDHFTTPVLAAHFKVSPEAIRRILKSKWRPDAEEEEDRRARWDKRGEKIWSSLVEKGVHAPKRWRQMGIGAGLRKAPTILFPAPSQTKRKAK